MIDLDRINELKEKIQDAEYVLIGIGEEFNETFRNIEQHQKIMKCLIQAENSNGKHEWVIPFLEKCYIDENTSSDTVEALKVLYDLVKDKNYFVMTTCIDGYAKNAGFDKEKIVEPCGSYELLQCEDNCNDETESSEAFVQKIREAVQNECIENIEQPICPYCGRPLVFNNIITEKYSETGYKTQWEKYKKWLQLTLNRKLCVIELGVGMNLPNVIRWPFEKIAFFNKKASFFRINETLYQLTEEIGEKGVSIEGNAKEILLREK